MTEYHNPKNEQPMDELYVVLSHENDGTEGIVSMMTPAGGMPLVFGHKRLLDRVLPSVRQISKDTGKTIVIAKFIKTEIIEKISTSN